MNTCLSSVVQMDPIDENSTVNNTGYIFEVYLSDTFVFWYYLILDIGFIPCYLAIFIYILTKKIERHALHNHSILVVLFISFCLVVFDYTWVVDSIQRNRIPWLQNTVFCRIWWFLDYGFYNSCTVVLAWTSFERHILIFHADLVRTKQKRIFFHYLPLFVLLLYLSMFYIYIIFFPSCESWYDYTALYCGGYPCFMDISYLSQWNLISHGIIPTLLITFFNLTLLIRVLWQKRHRRQDWRKCRKMAFQLLSISVVFLSLNLPGMIIILIEATIDPNWAALELGYFVFFSTLIHYLLPFICLASIPKIRRKIQLLFKCYGQQVIPVQSIELSRYPRK